MIRWRFAASSPALKTEIGERSDRFIQVRATEGWALTGPYVELPPGACVARVVFDGPGHGRVRMEIAADEGRRILASQIVALETLDGGPLELAVSIETSASHCEIRLHNEGDARYDIAMVEIDLDADRPSAPLDPERPVGFESRKTYADKIESGFFDRYLAGASILEIGYKGYIGGTVPIVPQAIGIDIDYPGYDGVTLPFADGSVDAIYSSHCFEHIGEYVAVLRDWYRLLKIGGHIVIVVPHQYLFEKRRAPPSPSNPDHKRFYTPESLCREVGEAFAENSYRIRHLAENDRGFNYEGLPHDPSYGGYEIEMVIEKIVKPIWNIDDGTVRAYSASEFSTDLPLGDPWSIEIDFSRTDQWLVWGPYVGLAPANYEVDFYFEAIGLNGPLMSPILFDVSRDMHSIVSLTLEGDDGRRALAGGHISLPFSGDTASGFYEFRLHASGVPFAGMLRFKGAAVRYRP